jgi:hypothetical protein
VRGLYDAPHARPHATQVDLRRRAAAQRTTCAARAEAARVFVGVPPALMQVPPTRLRSIRATVIPPLQAARQAADRLCGADNDGIEGPAHSAAAKARPAAIATASSSKAAG